MNPSSPQGEGTAVRLQWKEPVLMSKPVAFASSGVGPAVTISGSVKTNGGNANPVPGAPSARDDLGHHLALRRRPMRQHRLAGHVADGIDAMHRGAASVIDLDGPPVHIEVEGLEPPAAGSWLTADGDQDFVGGERRSRPSAVSTLRASPLGASLSPLRRSGSSRRARAGAVQSAGSNRNHIAGECADWASTTVTVAPILANAVPSSSPI